MSKKCQLTGKSFLKGNNVSHANNKSKRRYIPNLQTISLMSDKLKSKIRLKVAVSTIRTVEINNDIIFLILNDTLKNFDFSNTNFESISEFSFDINKKFKIKNLKIDSKLNLDEFLIKTPNINLPPYALKLKKRILSIK